MIILRSFNIILRGLINVFFTPHRYRSDYMMSLGMGFGSRRQLKSLPWMNYKVIDYLERRISPGFKVFEYGSGSSTRYWISQGCFVISIEHDSDFYYNNKDEIGAGCDYFLVEPDLADAQSLKSPESPDSFVSIDYQGFSFERYVKTIDNFPDEYFDMVVVDGRARPSCIKRALKKVAPNGIILLDNSDRIYYLSETKYLLSDWKRIDFRGAVRGLAHFEQTSIFQRS